MGKQLKPTILRFESLASTNTEAARQALRGAPEGVCVVAREQTQGRGRRARVWVSPKDAGLYFSIILRPAHFDIQKWPLITLMAGAAVQGALVEAYALATDIKWPNDILANERKLCGILAETVETETGRACVLGIGINLNDAAFPEELREVATSIIAQTGRAPDSEQLLQSLVRAIARRYEMLQAEGGADETLREWTARSSYAEGKRVRVALGSDAQAEILSGTTRGLEADGALRVETDAGEIRAVRAGDVAALRQAER